jgi:hypothetical protein
MHFYPPHIVNALSITSSFIRLLWWWLMKINYIPQVYIKCNPLLHWNISFKVSSEMGHSITAFKIYVVFLYEIKKIVYILFSQIQLTCVTEYWLLKTYCDHGKFSLPVISSTRRNETIAVVYAPRTLRHQWNEWLQAWHKHQKNGWYTQLWVPICLNHYKQCHSGFFHEFLNCCSYLAKNNNDRVT